MGIESFFVNFFKKKQPTDTVQDPEVSSDAPAIAESQTKALEDPYLSEDIAGVNVVRSRVLVKYTDEKGEGGVRLLGTYSTEFNYKGAHVVIGGTDCYGLYLIKAVDISLDNGENYNFVVISTGRTNPTYSVRDSDTDNEVDHWFHDDKKRDFKLAEQIIGVLNGETFKRGLPKYLAEKINSSPLQNPA